MPPRIRLQNEQFLIDENAGDDRANNWNTAMVVPGAGPEFDIPRIDFDQHSLEYRDGWREICDANLARCPVARTSANDGYWVVSGYEPLRKVIGDYRTFSSRWDLSPIRSGPAGISIPPGPFPKIPAELDPPEFFAYRRVISQSLTSERSDQLEPFIRRTVLDCLDRASVCGDIDLVLDLASPLATGVVAQVLGLPRDGREELAKAIHTVEYAKSETAEFDAAATVLASWVGVIESLIQSRREDPADDLVSELANCLIDDQPIPTGRITAICYLVLGSVDNTTGFIASALHWLHQRPDRRDALAKNPSQIPAAVEELLRYLAPIHGLARTATRDVELNGQHIRAGDRLWLHFAAANRDPAVFVNPDEVRLDRSPNRHASFGFGIHQCAGAPLTRIQARVTLETVLKHAPDYVIHFSRALRYDDIGKFNGFERMPATISRDRGGRP